MFWLKLPPPSNFDVPPPSQWRGTASPHVRNTCGKPCEEVYFFVMVIYILRIGIKFAVSHQSVFWYCLHSMGARLIFLNYFFLSIFYINTKLNSLGTSLWYLSPSLWWWWLNFIGIISCGFKGTAFKSTKYNNSHKINNNHHLEKLWK